MEGHKWRAIEGEYSLFVTSTWQASHILPQHVRDV